MSFGPWMMSAFKLLARFKFLRGTPFDIFGYSHERRTERSWSRDYEAMLDEVLGKLTPDNHPLAVGLAAIPEKIRGFGHVKARHLGPPRPTRRRSSSSSARASRRCSRRRSRRAGLRPAACSRSSLL